MFSKIEYNILISSYMTKDEYININEKYTEELNISYVSAS